jgi:autotransporter-associated beta strand protein
MVGGDYGSATGYAGSTALATLAPGSTLTFNGNAGSGKSYGGPAGGGTMYFITPGGRAQLAYTDLIIGNTLNTAGVTMLLAGINGGTTQVNSIAGGTNAQTYIASDSYPSTLQINNGTATGANFAGVIGNGAGAGTIAIVKSGTGMQILSGTNIYLGGTTVNGGTLQLGNNSALGAGGLTANAGVVDLAGYSPTQAYLAGAAGTITNSSTNLSTFSLATTTTAVTTFSGVLQDGASGAIALYAAGSGDLTLAASNAYSGGTTINGGTVTIASDSSLGLLAGGLSIGPGTLEIAGPIVSARNLAVTDPTATIQVDAGNSYVNSGLLSGTGGLNKTGGGGLVLAGSGSVGSTAYAYAGTMEIDGSYSLSSLAVLNSAQLAGSGNVSLTSSGLYYGSNASSTFAGAISGSGGLAVENGVLTLAGSNTYAGGTAVYSDANTTAPPTLRMGAANALPYGPGVGDLDVSGSATLDLAGFATNVNGLWGNGTIDNSSGSSTLAVGNNDASSTFAGTIQNSEGSLGLLKAGTGALTLSGTNDFSGGTVVADGTLILTNSEALAEGSSLTVGDASAFGTVLPAAELAIAPVPEPGTLAILAFGLLSAGIYRRTCRPARGSNRDVVQDRHLQQAGGDL